MNFFPLRLLARLQLILLALCLTDTTLAQSTNAYAGGNCAAINGMYVSLGNDSTGILGNTTKENNLLNFARNNGINYLIMYNLQGMGATSARANQLASLISRAKTQYGIHQVGAALGAASSADEIVSYNNAHSVNERIDVLNLEYEFWNEADRTTAFNHTINILDYFRSVGTANNLETEIYIGWITATEGTRLGNAVDRVLVHFYRMNDTDIINYGIERLQYLASASRKVRIAPIFSNEGPTNTGDPTSYFMGPWLETHPNDQAYKTWINGYNAITASWKNNLEVMGPTWFLYNYFADINVGKPNHITGNPNSQTACAGESRTFTVASNANTKNYCWMKDGKCLTDGGNISGAKTASLTVSNISNADYGNYAARVISYDANNPTSFTSTTATLTASSSCSGGTTNLALNKTVTASSFIAAGYEPYRAVDGNTTSSRWASAYSGSQWIQADLGASYTINRVKITWEAAYATEYQIQISSDNINWTTLRSIVGNNTLINDQTGLNGTGRYLRINGTAKALPAWGFSLFEFEVYGTAATATHNKALNKPVAVSSVEATGLEGNKAVDGNAATRWASAYTNAQWLRVDLGANTTVNRVKITWEAAYARAFKIQISNNGNQWTDIHSISNNTSLVNDINGLSATTRYLRIQGVERATAWGYSLFELEVY